ncbi:MAG TPA: DUF4824 family protein [Thermoanaerobaculia bacterium]|nr:DUF4824 family protein [Thermoanaerobaculia bacterium]
MKLRGLLAGLVLIALTNAAVLAGVAWNRRGGPEATVTLTERELQLPWGVGDEDDTGLILRLEWNPRGVGAALPEALPATTLRELGFRLSPPPGRHQPPRAAWVVLEMEGEAWKRWLAKRQRQVADVQREAEKSDCPPGSDLEQMQVRESRLILVDAGLDREALRRRHPDRSRFVIVPGVVGPDGVASELGLESIHVPLRLRPVLDEIVTAELVQRHRIAGVEDAPRPPRYRMAVAFGRRGEPWLVSVEKLPAPVVSPPAGFASAPPPALSDGCSG